MSGKNGNGLKSLYKIEVMCLADFFGRSVPSEEHLAKYVKDVIDDADAKDGYVFNTFYANSIFNNNPIDWDEVL